MVLVKATRTIFFSHLSYPKTFAFLLPSRISFLICLIIYFTYLLFLFQALLLLTLTFFHSRSFVFPTLLLSLSSFPPPASRCPFPRLSLPRPRSTRPPQIKPALCVFHGGFCVQMAKNCKTSKQVWLVRRPVKCRPPYTHPGFEIKCFTMRLRHTTSLSLYCKVFYSVGTYTVDSDLCVSVDSVLLVQIQTHVFF